MLIPTPYSTYSDQLTVEAITEQSETSPPIGSFPSRIDCVLYVSSWFPHLDWLYIHE